MKRNKAHLCRMYPALSALNTVGRKENLGELLSTLEPTCALAKTVCLCIQLGLADFKHLSNDERRRVSKRLSPYGKNLLLLARPSVNPKRRKRLFKQNGAGIATILSIVVPLIASWILSKTEK